MTRPVFALVDADGQIVRSSDGLDRLGIDLAAACARSTELEQVLGGEAESATLDVGEASFAIDAVTDSGGALHALLSLAVGSETTVGESEGPDDRVMRLRAQLEESPAIGWLKDLDGQYLHVNKHYVEELNVPEDRLRGHTDRDLSPGETVDGPRLGDTPEDTDEPRELEYFVPAFAGRPALTAVRFVIRDHDGSPIGTGGLAAPAEQSHMLREEAGRVARAERWSRMSLDAVRAELLEAWGLELGVPASNGDGSLSAERMRDDADAWSGSNPNDGFPTLEDVSHEEAADLKPGPALDLGEFFEGGEDDEPGEDVQPFEDVQRDEDAELGEDAHPGEASHGEAGPTPAPAPVSQGGGLSQRWDDCVQGLEDEARRWKEEVDRLSSLVEEAREQAIRALAERDTATAERDEFVLALARERERHRELVETIARLRTQISDVGRAIDQALPDETEGQSGELPLHVS